MLKDKLINSIQVYIKNRSLNMELGLGDNFRLSFLAQGEYNINYILTGNNKRYVFRVNTGSQLLLDNQIKYEFDALKALEHSGVTPKAFYLDDKKTEIGYGLLIMEYLEGRPLLYHRDLKNAAGIFAKLHSMDASQEGFKNLIVENNIFSERIKEAERLLTDFFPSPLIDIKLKRFFEKFLNWAEKNKHKEKYYIERQWHVINNTEVNSSNFIIGRENSWLIDWEKPVITDPCQDITQFLSPTTTLWKTDYRLSNEEIEDFFSQYVAELEYDHNIRERVEMYKPYLYLRALSWCAFAYLQYQREDKEINNADTYDKIKQYLEPGFFQELLKGYFT